MKTNQELKAIVKGIFGRGSLHKVKHIIFDERTISSGTNIITIDICIEELTGLNV